METCAPLPLKILDANDPALPIGLRCLLQRRNMFTTAYCFDIAPLIAEFLDGLILLDAMPDRQVGFLSICSLERSNATLRSGENAIIVFDLGFLEVLSDYLIVATGLHIRTRLSLSDADFWGEAAQTLSKAECSEIIRSVYRANGTTASYLDVLHDQQKTESQSFVAEWPKEVTGSQLFRDIAAKLMMTAWDGSYNRNIFEAFCVWTIQVGEKNYRPGPILANHILTSPNTPNELREQYWLAMAVGVRQILSHEYAHCMFDRSAPDRWRTTVEYRQIKRRLLASATRSSNTDSWWQSVLARLDDQSSRSQRAVSESFFDIRALNIIIAADGFPVRDAAWATLFLGFLIDVTLRNVAIMAMRDVMGEALRSSTEMTAAMTEALDEVQMRCALVFCALANMLADQYSEDAVTNLESRFINSVDQMLMLSRFFLMDLGSNLPISSNENGVVDSSDFAQGWSVLVDAIKSQA
jgi:hypothetical protein